MSDSITYVAFILCTLLVLNAVAILAVKKNVWKLLLCVPLNLLIVVILNLGVVFLQNTNPEMTGAINVLNTVFYISIFAVFPLLVLASLISIYGLVTDLYNPKKNKEDAWDKW